MTQPTLNWKRGPVDERDFISKRQTTAPTELPDEFQLPVDIPIYDQQNLGSCVSNSTCVCYRFEAWQLHNTFGFEPSRLFLYYNTREIEGTIYEDSGAYIRDAFKALNKKGLCEEQYFPYIESTFTDAPTQQAYKNGLKYQTLEYARVNQTVDAIRDVLCSGAAVTFGFDVYDSFFDENKWVDNVMPIPKKGEELLGGHAISCIGFSVEKQAFLIQNSWGEDWGDNGLFWMPFDFVISEHCDDFWCIEKINILEDTVEPDPQTPFDTVKELFTEDLILDASKSTIQHLAGVVGCSLKGTFRSKLAKQLAQFLYK